MSPKKGELLCFQQLINQFAYDANEIKTSIRTRKLVSSKVELEADINEKVFVVNSLEEMKSLSIEIAKYIKEDSFSKTQEFFKVG